jgi:hypothetical protein
LVELWLAANQVATFSFLTLELSGVRQRVCHERAGGHALLMSVKGIARRLATEEAVEVAHPPRLIKGEGRYRALVRCRIGTSRCSVLEDKLDSFSWSLIGIASENLACGEETDDWVRSIFAG